MSKNTESIKNKYPKGTKIELINICDEYSDLMPGDVGVVDYVDDLGTIHMKWENGSSLGLIEGIDSFTIIN